MCGIIGVAVKPITLTATFIFFLQSIKEHEIIINNTAVSSRSRHIFLVLSLIIHGSVEE